MTPSTHQREGGALRRYVAIEAVETLLLPHKRANACPMAQIDLGRFGSAWVNAIGFQQSGGDCWGSWEPLGHSADQKPRATFPNRDDALSDAIARMRAKLIRHPDEMAPQLAWLNALIPDQRDLFGQAA